MGEIQPNKCEGRELLTKDQPAGFARKIDDRFGQGIATLVAHPTATHFIFSDAQIFEAMFASVASFLQTHGHTHTPKPNPIEDGRSEQLPEGRLPPFARW